MRIFLGLLIIELLVMAAIAQHGHWTDRYFTVNEQGTKVKCCDVGRDCVPYPFRVLSQSKEAVTLEVDGEPVTIPQHSFHQSEEPYDYICRRVPTAPPTALNNIRCAFLAPGG